MPIQSCWLGEDKLIYHADINGNWTWEEAFADQEQMLRADVTNLFFLVLDFTHSHRRLPPNAVTNFRALGNKIHDKMYGTIIVSPRFKLLVNAMSPLFQLKDKAKRAIYAVGSFEEAQAIVDRYRSMLLLEAQDMQTSLHTSS